MLRGFSVVQEWLLLFFCDGCDIALGGYELLDASGYWNLGGSLLEMCLPVGLFEGFMSQSIKTYW